MQYCLEHSDEAQRLEFQAKLPNYQVAEEFKDLQINTLDRVLDAGCGSGLLSRYLVDRFSGINVEACDFSPMRVEQARSLAEKNGYGQIRFFRSTLENIASENSRYEQIVCRFVFEHLANPLNAAKEFYRVLKLAGRVCVVDLDGIVFNLHTRNPVLNSLTKELERGWKTDLYVGRKLPAILKAAGFCNIRWDVKIMQFQKENLQSELAMTQERFSFIRPTIAEILGSAAKADLFSALYCDEMMQEGSVLFYNKFIVYADKLEG